MKTNRRRDASQPNDPPAWQVERVNRLQHKFLHVERAMERGKSFKNAVKHFVWFWRDARYRSDRAKKVRFSIVTLRHLYRKWKRGGCVPAALKLNYRGLTPSVTAPVLCRFVEFCARLQIPHMNLAWQEFTRRKGWFGRGCPGKNPVKITYSQLQYFFSGKKFARLQSAQRAIERAENHLAELRLEYTAEIRQRLPDRPRRWRRTAEAVSLDASSL